MPRRSLFNQFSQVNGSRSFDDFSAYVELAETTGRSYLTGTLAVTSGSPTVVDSSNNFDRDELNNFVVITSGAAAGVYTVISGSDGNSAGLSPTPTATDAAAPYRRHYYQNLEDDLNYIRTQLDSIIGTVNWYDAPATDLKTLEYVSSVFTDTQEPSGFVNRTDSAISFDDGTMTLTISGSSFRYYILGEQFDKTGAESVEITDVEGMHYVYYDGATLTHTTTFSYDLLYNKAYVAAIYWDAANNTAIYIGDERHGITMDGQTHAYLHAAFGTQFIDGLGLTDVVADGDGTSNAHAQVGVATGHIRDEDLLFTLAAATAPASIPVFYKEGAGGVWRMSTATAYPAKSFVGGSSLLAWNEWTGSTWQQNEVADGGFVLSHIFATNDADSPFIVVQGQAEYGSVTTAREGANNEINALVLAGLPFAEFVPIGTLIYEVDSTYTNALLARVRTSDAGETYVDWRYSGYSPNPQSVADHANLTGRDTVNAHPAAAISVDYTTFSGILSTEDDVQEALETIDQHVHTESDITDLDKYTQAEVDALIAAKDTFIELNDTFSAYTDGNTLYTTASGVESNSNVTWDGSTFDVDGDLSVTGVFGFDTGTTVSAIVTSMGSSSTDDELPTAKAVYDAIEAKPNDFLGLTDTLTSYTENRVLFTTSSGVIDDADLTYNPSTDTFATTDINNSYIYADNNDDTSWSLFSVIDMLSAVRGEATQGNASGWSSGVYGNGSGGQQTAGVLGLGSSATSTSFGVAGDATGAPVNVGVQGTVGAYYPFTATPVSGSINKGVVGAVGTGGGTNIAYATAVEANVIGNDNGGSTNIVYGVYASATGGTSETWGLYVAAGDAYVAEDLSIDGTLALSIGTTVNEITTTVDSSSTDDQLPTAKAVYDEIASVSGAIDDALIWEIVDTPTNQVRVKTAYQDYALYHNGNVTIGGDLTVSGTTTTINSEELTVNDKLITVNYGEVGAGITGDQYAGIEVDRGSETNYQFVFDEVQDNFRVGISGSLQAVATREDVPNDGYIATWNATDVRFDTLYSITSGTIDENSTNYQLATADAIYVALSEQASASGTLDHALLSNLDYASSGHTGFAPTVHSHNDLYYTEDEVDSIISGLDYYSTGTIDGMFSALDYYTTGQVDSLISSITQDFIGLTDTPSSYTADRLLFTSASGVTWSDDITWDGSVLSTLSLALTTGATVDDISDDTTLSGSSSTALVTENAVKTYVDAKFTAETPVFYNVSLVRQSARVWTYGSGFTEVPDALQIYLNGVYQKASDSDYYTAAINGGALEITFGFDTYTEDWASVTYGTYAGALEAPSGGGASTLLELTDTPSSFDNGKYLQSTASGTVWAEASSSGLSAWTVVSGSGTTAVVSGRYMLDSSGGAFSITAPATPSTGDEVTFLDAGGSAGTYNITVSRNGSNIMGAAEDLAIDTDSASFSLVYFNSTRGWVIAD